MGVGTDGGRSFPRANIMTPSDLTPKCAEAAKEFNEHEKRNDGLRVASGLDTALSVLRESCYRRLHEDVERIVGMDSMLMPVSERHTEIATKTEIEIYQIAESHVAAQEFRFLRTQDDWFLQWLARLRLGPSRVDASLLGHIAWYVSAALDPRRLAFTDVLARVQPESRRAPLVLFHLFPLAVQIATCVAFGDLKIAGELRQRQMAILPAIGDCRQCHGRILESGEPCRVCGNPLWKAEVLSAD